MFVDIVHTAAQPAFVIGGKGKIILLAFGCIVPRLVYCAPDPYIVISIGVGMPQHQINIIPVGGICRTEGEVYAGFETAGPLITGDDYVLLKNIRRKGTGRPLKGTDGQEK
jgi:hypothetical protein